MFVSAATPQVSQTPPGRDWLQHLSLPQPARRNGVVQGGLMRKVAACSNFFHPPD
jgi:hypothetical protein